CRFLFGVGILVLIALSFWFYALQTEKLTYEQALASCRPLVELYLKDKHLSYLQSITDPQSGGKKWAHSLPKIDGKDLSRAMTLPDESPLQYEILQEGSPHADTYENNLYKRFLRDSEYLEDKRPRPNEQSWLYYAPIRAARNCIECHAPLAASNNQTPPREG